MSPARAKNPRSPQVPLTLPPGTVYQHGGALWRIHTTSGQYPAAWNDLRWTGPIRSQRWDPHPGPLGAQSTAGVSYTASSYITCFTEVFQAARAITLTSDRALSGWIPSRPLELLNLTGGEGSGDWALRHGATASLPQASKSTCRAWAAAIHDQLGDRIDGLWVPSAVVGDPAVVLFARAASAFSETPSFSRTLEHDDVRVMAAKVRKRLGWPIR
ncbi:RES family NAD+ phosphorylase [Brevibacterium sp. 'Marine']|uniref:RES family NAD+ phosphorylase n=1 Tax=Brevibacterium sp. 'Marine' TaxID=2725563 RepID=UPI00145CD30F|nr:RES family NAD+ phosphorylase [Brevibacterium sp. 'Marine']